jgi:hypothetical protein
MSGMVMVLCYPFPQSQDGQKMLGVVVLLLEHQPQFLKDNLKNLIKIF